MKAVWNLFIQVTFNLTEILCQLKIKHLNVAWTSHICANTEKNLFFFFPSKGAFDYSASPGIASSLCSGPALQFMQKSSSVPAASLFWLRPACAFSVELPQGKSGTDLVNRESMVWAQVSIWIPQFNVLFNSSFLRNNSRLLSIVSKANVSGSLT